ncbi:uncharacterized protein LOC118434345 [Folsomia candida]|uniref:uncharacterized protein LOC118434345 n=1 Tax=Folsomia candida TaxID=158441 RepID=UPI0016051A13|nr:uncharacterized protein LOC118434345 [Folsomia candida]
MNNSSNRMQFLGLTISPKNDGLSTVNLNVTSKKDTILLKIVYTRGNIPQQHKINVYGIGEDKPLLAVMNLESSFQHKGCILCVKSPPEHVIGYVYELPGISSVAIIQNEKQETILQILMNGEFGWSNSAKILSAKGDRKLGRMYKRKEGPTTTRNALHTVIHLPTDLPVPTKLILIGTCLNLMGRSQI